MLKAILIAAVLHFSAADDLNLTDPYSINPNEFTTVARGKNSNLPADSQLLTGSLGTICNSQHGVCLTLCSKKVNINTCDSVCSQSQLCSIQL